MLKGEEAKMAKRAHALLTGKKVIPFRCAWCHGHSLVKEQMEGVNIDVLMCLSCGRETMPDTARVQRHYEMQAYIKEGRTK
jgi:hypothetical protein